MFDSGSEEPAATVSTSAMVLELATVLLGACVGAVAVLYAAPRGYLGHPRKRGFGSAITSLESYTTATEKAQAPTVVEPAPAPIQALYETVQPTPAPVIYTAPSSTSFGAPTLSKKPVRNYRRRTAPVRSVGGAKVARTKPKKR